MHATRHLLALFVVAMFVGGCSTGTTYTGTAYRMKLDRTLEAHLDAPIDTVHGVAREVLEEQLLYAITADELDAREGVIKSRTARNRYVRVETFAAGDAVTRVEIYVSPLGDEAVALDILRRLEERLN